MTSGIIKFFKDSSKTVALPVSPANPLPVVISGGGGGGSITTIQGRDRDGTARIVLTDALGRQKISHAQPDPIVVDLLQVSDALLIGVDSLSDVMFFMRGAAHAGFNLTFEYSPDTTATPGFNAGTADGTWYPFAAKNVGAATSSPGSATGVLGSNSATSWEGSVPAAVMARVRVTARTSGTLTVGGLASTAARPTWVGAFVTGGTVAATIAAGTTSMVKAEDAAHTSGDAGVHILGVRVPATPASQTSAAGDYGSVAVTSDGKTVTAGQGAEEHTFLAGVTITNTAASTLIKGAAGAGVRNYVTDLLVSNGHSAAVFLQLLDGATALGVPILLEPNKLTVIRLGTGVRTSANAALNGQLSAAVAGAVNINVTGYLGV